MKRLIIDLGNTQGKLAVYDGPTRVAEVIHCQRDQLVNEAERICIDHQITQGAIASVVANDGIAETMAEYGICITRVNTSMPLPFRLGYSNPRTLGIDRVAAVAGAVARKGLCPMLIVDIGTMVTYEVLTADGVYAGGCISPGAEARFEAMHNCASLLPRASVTDYREWIGTSTPSALAAGVVNGLAFEIEGYIQKTRKEIGGLHNVILTGGGAQYFADRLNETVVVEPDLVLDGVAFISASTTEQALWQTI